MSVPLPSHSNSLSSHNNNNNNNKRTSLSLLLDEDSLHFNHITNITTTPTTTTTTRAYGSYTDRDRSGNYSPIHTNNASSDILNPRKTYKPNTTMSSIYYSNNNNINTYPLATDTAGSGSLMSSLGGLSIPTTITANNNNNNNTNNNNTNNNNTSYQRPTSSGSVDTTTSFASALSVQSFLPNTNTGHQTAYVNTGHSSTASITSSTTNNTHNTTTTTNNNNKYSTSNNNNNNNRIRSPHPSKAIRGTPKKVVSVNQTQYQQNLDNNSTFEVSSSDAKTIVNMIHMSSLILI
jgi:hypothetical protein